MKNLVLVLFIFMFSLTSVAAQLSNSSVLRKISLQLQGRLPTLKEYQDLKTAEQQGQLTEFLSGKIDEYQNTESFSYLMQNKLKEHFHFKAGVQSLGSFSSSSSYSSSDILAYVDAASHLIDDLFTKNLSWDTLLTEKNYRFYASNNFSSFSSDDRSFFSLISKPIATGNILPTYNAFSEFKTEHQSNDSRLAGLITTSRFSNRYVNTAINKNRRRAAAIYRIFLCDPMMAAVGAGTSDLKQKYLSAAFQNTNTPVTEEALQAQLSQSQETLHGQKAECMSCHVKLDPMGKTMEGLSTSLLPTARPGALVVKHGNDLTSYPVQSLGELAEKITTLPEYSLCQTKWFWNEFIGKDVFLSETSNQKLAETFDQLGRKPKDFIKTLMLSSAFRTIPEASDTVLFSHVKPILNRCDSCHTTNESDVPNFSKLPISLSGNPTEQPVWLQKMLNSMNLPEGDKKRMPRDMKNWKTEEVQLLLKWLNSGAPDDNGQPLFKPGANP